MSAPLNVRDDLVVLNFVARQVSATGFVASGLLEKAACYRKRVAADSAIVPLAPHKYGESRLTNESLSRTGVERRDNTSRVMASLSAMT